MAPARVLTAEPEDALLDLGRQPWAARPATVPPPFPADEHLVPAQERARRDEERRAHRTRQVASGGSEEGSISRQQRWPADLTAQDLQLVMEDHQLNVLDVGAASAADEQAEQRPKSEVRRKNMAPILPNPRLGERDPSNGTLHGQLVLGVRTGFVGGESDARIHPPTEVTRQSQLRECDGLIAITLDPGRLLAAARARFPNSERWSALTHMLVLSRRPLPRRI